MWTYNNTCTNMNFRNKDLKMGILYLVRNRKGVQKAGFRELQKGGIKSKQNLKHAACI